MKNKRVFFPLIVFLLIFVYQCGDDSSPTTPAKPKKRAIVEIDIKNLPISCYLTWRNEWHADYTVILSEHNGVGVDISRVKTEIFEGDKRCASATEGGGRLPPSGSLEVWCSFDVPAKYQFDKQTITAEGIDDNGHRIEVSMSLTWTWDNNRLTLIK